MRLGRRLKNQPWVQKTVGILAAEYLRLVWTTSRFTMEPAEPYRLYESQQPVIIAMWHGQHFLLPFLRRQYRFRVLISRHSDGEINAIAAERLGVGTVRGSGDHGTRFHIKGGVAGFKAMLELARARLEHGADCRRAEGFACRRPRHRQTCARVGTTDLSCQPWPPAAASCSTIGIARKSTCRSAAAELSSANRSEFPRMQTRPCCNRPARRLKTRSTPRPNVLTRSPIVGLEHIGISGAACD